MRLQENLQTELKELIINEFKGGVEEFNDELKRTLNFVSEEDGKLINNARLYYSRIFFEDVPIIQDTKQHYDLTRLTYDCFERNSKKLGCNVFRFCADLISLKVERVTGIEFKKAN